MSYTNLPWKALGLLFVPLALSAQPVQAQDSGSANQPLTVRITEGNPYNIYGATHTGTDSLGNVYGFSDVNINYEYWDCTPATDPETGEYLYNEWGSQLYRPNTFYLYMGVTFNGAVTEKSSITLPDTIILEFVMPEDVRNEYANYGYPLVNDSSYTVTGGIGAISLHSDVNDKSFPNSNKLTDIIVPFSIFSMSWSGDEFENARNYRLLEHCEVMDGSYKLFQNSSKSVINIIIPDNQYFEYKNEYLASSEGSFSFQSTSPMEPTTVNVETPGTLAETVSTLVEDLGNVRWLIVTGTPDELDMRLFRRMPHLEILDLSGTTGVEKVAGCNGLEYLTNVILPDGMTEIGESAFADCRSLSSINIPDGVTNIGNNAFRDCPVLRSVELPASVKSIGNSGFYRSGIQDINLHYVENIGSNAFNNCSLKSIDISNISYLHDSTFGSNEYLTEIIWGNKINSIGTYAFRSCYNLTEIILPESLERIEYEAFSNCYNVSRVEIGKNIKEINDWSFSNINPGIVISRVLFPLNYHGFERGCDVSKCTLFVPSLTLNEYMISDAYVNFPSIEPLEEDLTELTLDREYILKSDKGIADKANVEIGYNRLIDEMWHSATGNLTVARKADLNLGKLSMYGRATEEHYTGNGYEWYYDGSTFIPESNVTAEELEINLDLRVETWHFLSFPFDVNVKDIVVDDDALWVVRKYSGEDRAKLNENTWQNMADETVLKAGEGYIFHCARENSDRVHFTFRPAASNEGFFAKDAVSTPLANYPSEFAHNASWNLVGNPYPAYLNLKGLDFTAPVTLWQNGTYYAYSPVDDELALDPFKAFFVQRQDIEGGDAISFNPAARAHSRETALALDFTPANAPARAARLGNSPRALFNIFVKGENGTDRTRLVINEEASTAYEASCDAAKFMSSEISVPQIFVMNGNSRMAIDERPLAEGVFTLGSRFGAKGEYAISLETRNADGFRAMLTDNKTGVTTDITASAYAFTADEGTDNNRFTLALTNTLSGINDAALSAGISVNMNGNILSVTAPEAVEITVAAADGKVVASANSADFSAELAQGIYVVKAGNTVTKVIAQ